MNRFLLQNIFLCFSLSMVSACGSLAFWEQEDSKTEEVAQGIPLAEMTLDENGDILAVMGEGEQMIEAASDGELAGTSIIFAAGALALGTEVQVATGSSLATATTQSELGMTGTMEQASATVNIIAADDVVLQAPLTIAIALSSAPSLHLIEEMQYAVLCKMKMPGEEKLSLEVWSDAKFTITEDRVQFETMYFGSYQVIKIPKNITMPTKVLTSTPILNKAVESALEPLSLVATAAKSANGSSASIQYTLKGEGSIEKCMLFPDSDGKLPFELKGIDIGTKTSYLYTAKIKEGLFFAIGCRDKNGRELALAWTSKVSLEAPVAAAVEVVPPPKSRPYCAGYGITSCTVDPNNPWKWHLVMNQSYVDLKFETDDLLTNDLYRIKDVAESYSCSSNTDSWQTWADNNYSNFMIHVPNLTATVTVKYFCFEGKKSDNTAVMSDKLILSITYQQ